jgi:hypothetical protein
MPRLPYAAVTLAEQVRVERPKAKMEPTEGPDGLGVYRTVKFDKRTSDWLYPLLEVIDDSRIEEFHVTEAGYLHVTFIPQPQADQRTRFPLAEARQVLDADAQASDGD